MNGMTTLTTALLDLLKNIENADVPLIIGGGYGIYLRHMRVVEERWRTLFATFPEPRSTNDLDLFLRAELLLDSTRLKPLRDALNRLGYEVIEGAEHYQFVRPGPGGNQERGIKIDVLTGPTKPFKGTHVRFDKRRVRPKPSVTSPKERLRRRIGITGAARSPPSRAAGAVLTWTPAQAAG